MALKVKLIHLRRRRAHFVTMCVVGSAEGVLVLYSLSKQSNMAGYRTAFIAGDESLIASMSAYRKQIGQIIPGPVQAAMAAGLRDLRIAVKVQHAHYRERLGVLVSASACLRILHRHAATARCTCG